MFFRHEKPHVPTFSELMDGLRKQGFTVQPETGGGMRVSRGGCAAVVTEKAAGAPPHVSKAGVLLGPEIALLCDGGYQKFWVAPSGKRAPAAADHLHALHNFEEDLREGLGLVSLYNQSLGTVNELHLYDRVKDRDQGVPRRPWERQALPLT
jgi:hypothetical protein